MDRPHGHALPPVFRLTETDAGLVRSRPLGPPSATVVLKADRLSLTSVSWVVTVLLVTPGDESTRSAL